MKKRHLLASALALAFYGSAAVASDITITTGGKGGSYNTTGEKLAEMLRGFDHTVTVERSAGSVENINRVASGEATLGFTQLDALYRMVPSSDCRKPCETSIQLIMVPNNNDYWVGLAHFVG